MQPRTPGTCLSLQLSLVPCWTRPRLPLDTGLCGAAATTGKVIVVQDVSADPRYLAVSSLVKSEIVVPIFVNTKLAAELDIESYFANTFSQPEQQFVESCASVLATYLAKPH